MANSANSPPASALARTLTISLTLALLAAALTCWLRFPGAPGPRGFEPAQVEPAGEAPRYTSRFVTHGETREVHAASAVVLANGDLLAVWYGGTREGAGDVAIYSARFDAGNSAWGAPRKVIDRDTASHQLGRHVRKLGNPVLCQPDPATTWLFYVSVSVGGWAGSSINLAVSPDAGESWGASRRLVTSPFFNLSTLVKGPAFAFANGQIGLPVYHEFIGKFGELLILDRHGTLIDKQRLSNGAHSLQPVIVPLDPGHAAGFMRYAGGAPERILQFESADGGMSWSEPAKGALPNPNAAVSALRLPDGDLLLAFNDSPSERDNLRLARSRDRGRTWQIVATVEPSGEVTLEREPEFSYPWMTIDERGRIDLLYTWHKHEIKHVQFNLAWLDRATREGAAAP